MSKITNWLKQESGKAGLEIRLRRLRRSNSRRKVIYFLHIGKAAGSQIKQAIRQINENESKIAIYPQNHDIFLEDVPEEAEYFVSIRNPITRFYSGFYSRKRKGRPLNDIDWTSHEASAFNRFEHANELAESLFAPGEKGMFALAAIKSIRHTAQDQIDWFALAGDLFTVRPPIWVIRQERFEEDFATFLTRAGITHQPVFARSTKRSHANDYSSTPPLTEKAKANLKIWYAQDLALYEAIETWMSGQI